METNATRQAGDIYIRRVDISRFIKRVANVVHANTLVSGDISLRWRLMPEAKLQKKLIAEGSVTAEGAIVIYPYPGPTFNI